MAEQFFYSVVKEWFYKALGASLGAALPELIEALSTAWATSQGLKAFASCGVWDTKLQRSS